VSRSCARLVATAGGRDAAGAAYSCASSSAPSGAPVPGLVSANGLDLRDALDRLQLRREVEDGRDRRSACGRAGSSNQDRDRRRLAGREVLDERHPRVAARHAGRIDRRIGDPLDESQERRTRDQEERQHGDEDREGSPHDRVRDLLPAGSPDRGVVASYAEATQEASDGQGVDPWPEHAEDRRQERQRESDRADGDDRTAKPDRRESGRLEPQEARQPDCHRDAREEDRLACRRDGALDGLLDRPPARELLAEPARDEERVVDRECEPEHRRDVQHEDAHLEALREHADQPDRARDGDEGHEQRHPGGDQGAEHQHEHDRGDRQGHDLGPFEVLLRGRGGVALDRPEPGELDGIACRRREGGLDRCDRRDRLVVGLVEPDEHVGLAALDADEPLVAGLGVAGDHRDMVQLPNRCEGRSDGLLEGGARGIGRRVRRLDQGDEGRPTPAEVGIEALRDLGRLGRRIQPAAGRETAGGAGRE
jgi:hypothetical protein